MLFLKILYTEFLKLKRTNIVYLTFIFPLFILYVLFLFFTSMNKASFFASNLWPHFFGSVAKSLGIFILPVFIILFTVKLADIEKISNYFRLYFSLPVSKWVIFPAKLIVVHILLIATIVFLFLFSILAGYGMAAIVPKLNFHSFPPLYEGFGVYFRQYVNAWAIISLHLLIGLIAKQAHTSAGIGLGLFVGAMSIFSNKFLYYYIWNLTSSQENSPVFDFFSSPEQSLKTVIFLIVTIYGCIKMQQKYTY